MTDAEVVVVGAGPTGAACALSLAHRAPELAARTVVLDKARHPREKPCAGAVAGWGVRALERLGVGVAVPHVPIRGIAVRFGGQEATARAVAGQSLGVVLRRRELDASLAAAARGVVGELREDAKVVEIARDGVRFVVRTLAGDVRARVVVGADGSGSAVRRLLGFGEPRRKAQALVVETAPAPGDPERGVLRFDLSCLRAGVQGYSWDFPTVLDGAAAVSRGVYHLNAHRPSPGEDRIALAELLDDLLRQRGIDPAVVRPQAFSERGWAPAAEIARPGVLLAGEAAGVDPVSGEGIAHALVFGELAAAAVADAFARGDLGFSGYGRAVRRSLVGRHLGHSAQLAPHVYGRRARFWASFLVQDPRAIQAGLRWYAGERLGLATKARLALGLARHFARLSL